MHYILARRISRSVACKCGLREKYTRMPEALLLGLACRQGTEKLSSKFLDQPLSSHVSIQKTSVEQREILTEFFELPYWKRAWIIQEVAVGSSLTILCGRHRIN
jgi:hypothetical protein